MGAEEQRDVIEVLGHRWAPRILAELRSGPLGFRALRYRCPWISSSVLTPRLRELQEAGLVARDDEGRYILTGEGHGLVAGLAYADDRRGVQGFVERWLDSRQRGDIEGIVSLYAEGAVFLTPSAEMLTGTREVHGRNALREYWMQAYERLGPLEFSDPDASWDGHRRRLVITYVHGYSGRRVRACEVLCLDRDWLVVEAEALFGARV